MHTTRRYAPFLLFVLAITLAPMTASAAITFVSSNQLGVNVFQQQQNSPCVEGDMSCKEPANFSDEEVSGTPGGNNGSSYDLFTPVYVGDAGILGIAGPTPDDIPVSFSIGIDDNFATGQGNEFLVAFNVYKCTGFSATNTGGTSDPGTGCVIDSANSYQPATPTMIPDNHNGNGFSDVVLQGFSLTVGSFYVFEAKISNDSDGMEEFFIIPSGTPAFTPEPGSILMLGTTLIGIGAITRRRLNRKNAR